MSEQPETLEALRKAFEDHYAALLRLAVLLTHDRHAGEDLVQEAFARSARALARLDANEVRPYLRAVVVNVWRNQMRRRTVERRALVVDARPDVSADAPIEDRDAVWRAIARLPDRQRTCVVLRYFEDLPHEEIARLMGSSVGTVKSQVSRALERLREELPRDD